MTDEDAFESIKASLDSVPPGAKMILNSGVFIYIYMCVYPFNPYYNSLGEFYGINPREANLELVARFFEKYPEYADKAFLSVKESFFCIQAGVLLKVTLIFPFQIGGHEARQSRARLLVRSFLLVP